MPIKKKLIFLLAITILCFIMVGCALSSISEETGTASIDNSGISSNAYNKVNTQDEIFAALLSTMQNNEKECLFFVTSQDMINADSWLTKLNGIEQVHCDYRRIKDGYNVAVTLSYWDNYSIVNAYKAGSTKLLTPKQLELYNKYCEILAQYTSKGASDWDNELAIHDYLVSNVKYELVDDAIYNAYDTLINGTAVCNGYAECFKTFMDMLGIECTAISGSANGELHIWNLVKLGGAWYQVDVTWDDPINGKGRIEHAYFNITDSDMAKDHTWVSSNYPVATGAEHSYPNIKGLPSFSNDKDLTSYLTGSLKNKADFVEFVATNTIDLKTAISKCGINVTYSYNISNYANYILYKLEFTY